MASKETNKIRSFTSSDEVFVGDVIPSYIGLRRIITVEGDLSVDGYVWIQTIPATFLQKLRFNIQKIRGIY
jgi:hypothetical protein